MQNVSKYSNGERVILFTSDGGAEILDHVDEKLQLASAELLRMEDEGGTPLTQQQTAKISAYAKTRKRIKELFFTRKRRQPDLKATQE